MHRHFGMFDAFWNWNSWSRYIRYPSWGGHTNDGMLGTSPIKHQRWHGGKLIAEFQTVLRKELEEQYKEKEHRIYYLNKNRRRGYCPKSCKTVRNLRLDQKVQELQDIKGERRSQDGRTDIEGTHQESLSIGIWKCTFLRKLRWKNCENMYIFWVMNSHNQVDGSPVLNHQKTLHIISKGTSCISPKVFSENQNGDDQGVRVPDHYINVRQKAIMLSSKQRERKFKNLETVSNLILVKNPGHVGRELLLPQIKKFILSDNLTLSMVLF